MSRPTARLAVAALLCAAVSLPASPAFAAPRATSTCAKAKKAKRCAKPKAKPKPAAAATPVTVDLLEGSQATVDVAAIPLPGGSVLPGMPVTRTVPISGRLKGAIPGGYMLGRTNAISLNDGAITPGPVDILSDAACGGAAALRLNPASTVILDKAAPSAGKVFTDGRVTADVRVLLRLAFDSRTATACDSPLVTMGWAPTALPVSLAGTVEKGTGLSRLTLDAPAVPVTVAVCLTPGTAGAPCTTPSLGYPVTIAVHAIVKVAIG